MAKGMPTRLREHSCILLHMCRVLQTYCNYKTSASGALCLMVRAKAAWRFRVEDLQTSYKQLPGARVTEPRP